MVKHLLVTWIVVAAGIAISAALLPSVDVEGGVLGLLLVALVFGLVNALVGPLLRLVSLPLTLMTFGLFSLVINAALLAITAALTDSLDIGGVLETIVAALVISVVTAVLMWVTGRFLAPEPKTSS